MCRFPRCTQTVHLDVKCLDWDPDFLTTSNRDTKVGNSKDYPKQYKIWGNWPIKPIYNGSKFSNLSGLS